MKPNLKFGFCVLAACAVSACGGGGGNAGPDSVAPPTSLAAPLVFQVPAAAGMRAGAAPPATAAPTYALQNTSGEATEALAEVLAGYSAAPAAADGADFRGPAGSQWATLAAALGFSTTLNCANLGVGGSGSITVTSSGAAAVTGLAGSSLKFVYNACSIAGLTTNGEYSIVFSRYTSANDFAYTSSWKNLSVASATQGAQPAKTYAGTQSCANANGNVTCNYSDTSGRSWAGGVSMANALLNGSYATNFPGGVVSVKYTNFGAVGGTAEISGANGSKAVITFNSATKFTVVVTVDGVSTTYTFGA